MTNSTDAALGESARRWARIALGGALVLAALEMALALISGSGEPWLRRYKGIASTVALAAGAGAILIPDRPLVQRVLQVATWVFLALGTAGLVADIRAEF